eukprot:g6287.t1
MRHGPVGERNHEHRALRHVEREKRAQLKNTIKIKKEMTMNEAQLKNLRAAALFQPKNKDEGEGEGKGEGWCESGGAKTGAGGGGTETSKKGRRVSREEESDRLAALASKMAAEEQRRKVLEKAQEKLKLRAELLHIFEMFDINGGGSIDPEEMYAEFNSAGLLHSDAERRRVKRHFQYMDKDKNGHIDFAEFLDATIGAVNRSFKTLQMERVAASMSNDLFVLLITLRRMRLHARADAAVKAGDSQATFALLRNASRLDLLALKLQDASDMRFVWMAVRAGGAPFAAYKHGGGFSIFFKSVNVLQIILHFFGGMWNAWFIIYEWSYSYLWNSFVVFNLLPALAEIGVLFSIFVLKVVPF